MTNQTTYDPETAAAVKGEARLDAASHCLSQARYHLTHAPATSDVMALGMRLDTLTRELNQAYAGFRDEAQRIGAVGTR